MSDVILKPLTQSHDQETGITTHQHGIFEGDQQVGTLHVAVGKDGQPSGFKLKGGKMKHFPAAMAYLQQAHPDLMKKALADTNGTTKMDTSNPNLAPHDKLRVRAAIRALLGKKETPDSPDGKVNRLEKAFASKAAMSQYKTMLGQMQDLSEHVIKRADNPHMSGHHDNAAYMLINAREQLSHARRHMLQSTPSKVDHLRALFGMQPMHMKHLRAAGYYLTAAKTFAIKGDRDMHQAGHLVEGSELMLQGSPKLPSAAKVMLSRAFSKVNNRTSGSAFHLKTISDQAHAQAAAHAKQKAASARPRRARPSDHA